MVRRPAVEFAFNGDVTLAYQVVGNGPVDVLLLPGLLSNLDLQWESPSLAAFLNGLAEGHRLIISDRRGLGLSERHSPGHITPIEALVEDMLAVLAAAGSKQAVVIGFFESGMIAQMLAAAHPQRVLGLVLIDSFATGMPTDETPWIPAADEDISDTYWSEWGRVPGSDTDYLDDPEERDWFVRFERASSTVMTRIAESQRWRMTDTRGLLGSIHCPTLIMQDLDGIEVGVGPNGRFLQERIPNARLVEHHGEDQYWWHKPATQIVSELRAFTASLSEHDPSLDRVLATVLFTDIVGSTAQAAALGDRGWRALRERHDEIVRSELARFRGREIKTIGDGFLATFDGPARGVRCAQEIAAAVRALDVEIRAGLHTGEIELDGDDISGIGVAISARVGSLAQPSEVLVSQTIKDLTVGAGLLFADRGEHELKGVPGAWRLYAAADG